LGYNKTAVILIQTSGRITYIKNTISKMPNVLCVYQIAGDFDVVLTAKFKENSELATLVKQLQKINGVYRIVPGVALDVIKEETTSLCVA
jgi:Lrp/AsnC family transcriptional regulator for asnA, asnC and gidA